MSFVALLVILLDIACVIHAFRTDRPRWWWLVIVFFSPFGALAYLGLEVVPEYFGGPATKARREVGRRLDPHKQYRLLTDRLEAADTPDTRQQLADECLALDRPQEAVAHYRAALTGIHATDPKLMLGLARAAFAAGEMQTTLDTLDALRDANPEFQSADGHLLYARALDGLRRDDAAAAEYAALVAYYPGEEARARAAQLAQRQGRADDAARLFREIVRSVERAPPYYKGREREWYELARRNGGR